MNTDKTRSPSVLSRSINLLKLISTYPPSPASASAIDAFCAKQQGEISSGRMAFAGPSTAQALAYVRGVLAGQPGSMSGANSSSASMSSSSSVKGSMLSAGAASATAAAGAAAAGGAGAAGHGGGSGAGALSGAGLRSPAAQTSSAAQLSGLFVPPSTAVTGSVLRQRPTPSVFPKSDAGLATLAHAAAFGGYLHAGARSATAAAAAAAAAGGSALPPAQGASGGSGAGASGVGADDSPHRAAFAVSPSSELLELVRAMRVAEEAARRGAPRLAKAARLFQYSYYNEQRPMNASRDVLASVIAKVSSPSSDPEERTLASQVLIKALVDVVLSGHGSAWAVIEDVLLSVVESPAATVRAHAFALLFNLSLHFLMLGDPAKIGAKIAQVQGELCRVLFALAARAVHRHEQSDAVWDALFRAVAHLTNLGPGAVDRSRAEMAPAEVLRELCVRAESLPGGPALVARLLVAWLYPKPQGPLDPARLERLGGLATVVEMYAVSSSLEAQENLFAVLFDSVITSLEKKRKGAADPECVEVILELFQRYIILAF